MTRDRDRYTDKHRTPRTGVPEFVDEECTGRHEGDELRRMRSRRSTPVRLQRLEDKDDLRAEDIASIKSDVAGMRGDVKAMAVQIGTIAKTLERTERREDVEFADQVAARKAKREAVLKVALYIITGGLVGKILHTLGLL